MTTVTADHVRAEMQAAVRLAAEPSYLGEHIATAINRAARHLGLSPSRAKRLWYGEVQNIPAFEADTIRLRVEALSARNAQLGQLLKDQHDRLQALAAMGRGSSRGVLQPQGMAVVAARRSDRDLDQGAG